MVKVDFNADYIAAGEKCKIAGLIRVKSRQIGCPRLADLALGSLVNGRAGCTGSGSLRVLGKTADSMEN